MLRSLPVPILCVFWLSSVTSVASAQEKSAAAWEAIGQKHLDEGKMPEAEQAFQSAMRTYENETGAAPNNAPLLVSLCVCRNKLASTQSRLFKVAEAKALFAATDDYLKKVIAARPTDPAFLHARVKTLQDWSDACQRLYLFREAETIQRDAVAAIRKLSQEHPARLEYRVDLVQFLQRRADLLRDAFAQYAEAEALYQEAREAARKLIADDPKSPAHVAELAVVYNSYSLLVRESGRYAESVDMMREAIRLLTYLEKAYPNNPEHWFMLPAVLRNTMQPLGYMQRTVEIEAARREATRVEEKLKKMPDAETRWVNSRRNLAASVLSGDLTRFATMKKEIDNLNQEAEGRAQAPLTPYSAFLLSAGKGFRGMHLANQGHRGEALKDLAAAKEILEKATSQWPHLIAFREVLAEMWVSHGSVTIAAGDFEGGVKHIRVGLTQAAKLADEFPDVPRFRWKQADLLARVTLGLQGAHGPREMLPFQKESQEVIARLAKEFPRCPLYRRHDAAGCLTESMLHLALGNDTDAVSANDRAIRVWSQVTADFPTVDVFRESCAQAHANQGILLAKHEKFADAEKAYAEAERIFRDRCDKQPKHADSFAAHGKALSWLAQMREKQGRPADALAVHTQAIAAYETALSLNPRQRAWLETLKVLHDQRAHCYLKLGQQAEYFRAEEKTKTIAEMLEAPYVRLARIERRTDARETALALKEAEDLFLNIDLSHRDWHHLACAYAKLAVAEKDGKQREILIGRVLAAVRKALDEGLPAERLRNDPQLQPFLSLPAFRELTSAQ